MTNKTHTNRNIDDAITQARLWVASISAFWYILAFVIVVTIPRAYRAIGEAGRAAALVYQTDMAYAPFEVYVRLCQAQAAAIYVALVVVTIIVFNRFVK